ncbi:MAG: hypothetical protein ABI330_20465 [Caldimonas sp.]
MKHVLLVVAGASLCCQVVAAPNRCVDSKGKVTYQDAACSGAAEGSAKVDTSEGFSTLPRSAPAPAVPAAKVHSNALPGVPSDYGTYRGAWRGPLQFELSLNGVRDGDAHAMAPMVIELRPDGEAAR